MLPHLGEKEREIWDLESVAMTERISCTFDPWMEDITVTIKISHPPSCSLDPCEEGGLEPVTFTSSLQGVGQI